MTDGPVPADPRVMVEVLLAHKRWQQAIEALDGWLATHPDDGVAWGQRAAALHGLGDFDSALAAAERAAGLRPGDEWPQRLRALAYTGKGQHRRAVQAAEAAVAIDPTSDPAQVTLANALLAMRRRRAAEAAARVVIERSPTSVDAWVIVGHSLLGRNNVAAAESFQRALAIDPTSSEAVTGLGMAYQNVGMRQQAGALYTRAAALSPATQLPRDNLMRLVAGGGSFVLLLAIVQLARTTNLAAALGLAAVALAVGTPWIAHRRRKALAALPDEARDYVVAERRASRRRWTDPRKWPALVRSDGRRIAAGTFWALSLVGIIVFVQLDARGTEREREEERREEFLEQVDRALDHLRSTTTMPARPVVVVPCQGSTPPILVDGVDVRCRG